MDVWVGWLVVCGRFCCKISWWDEGVQRERSRADMRHNIFHVDICINDVVRFGDRLLLSSCLGWISLGGWGVVLI